MNLKEILEEAGYHVTREGDNVLQVYHYGEHIVTLKRYTKTAAWTDMLGRRASLSFVNSLDAELVARGCNGTK